MASYNIELGAIEKEVLHIFILRYTGTKWTIHDQCVPVDVSKVKATLYGHCVCCLRMPSTVSVKLVEYTIRFIGVMYCAHKYHE